MGTLLQDLRYAVRMMLRSPGLTAVAMLSLAIGIGVNSAIFSVINGILLRNLPIKDVDRVVVLYTKTNISYPDYIDYRDGNDLFSGLTAYTPVPLNLNTGDRPERIFGWVVTGNYFSVLGVRAAVGRTLGPQDDQAPGASPVAVLSYNIWRNRFGKDPGVVGKTITLNGNSFTVVGVVQEGFTGTLPAFSPDVWVPVMMQAQLVPGPDLLNKRDDPWLEVSGRLKPGVNLKQAQTAVNTITSRLEQAYPAEKPRAKVTLYKIGNGDPAMRRDLLPIATVVLLMVSLVLLIACVNVATLLLTRAAVRRKEIAIRLAVGAGRRRLIRQLLTESVALALLGGACAVLLAFCVNKALSVFIIPVGGPVELNLTLDMNVLVYTLILSVITGLVFGMLPALQSSKPDVIAVLKGDSSIAPRAMRRFGIRNLLVNGQIAVSLILLIAAGLLVRSLQVARGIDPGFAHENVLTMAVDLSLNNYSKEQTQVFFRQLAENVKSLPGVESVSLARTVPLGIIGDEGEGKQELVLEGQAAAPEAGAARSEQRQLDSNVVSPGYFATMGIPIVRGRDFNEQDRDGTQPVGIINETTARRFWPNTDPIGKRFSIKGPNGPYLEVVGVAKDSKYRSIGETPRPYLYLPLLQNQQSGMRLLVRSANNPMGLVAAVRGEVEKLDKNLATFETKTMDEQINEALFPARTAATLFSIFGLTGLLLTLVGLYGVISYFVSDRTHEIGIRMALGAQRRQILGLVIGQGMKTIVIGLVIGLLGAFAVTRIMASVLYGVSAADPVTFVGVSLLLVAVSLLACYLPARRATKVDPMISLRYE